MKNHIRTYRPRLTEVTETLSDKKKSWKTEVEYTVLLVIWYQARESLHFRSKCHFNNGKNKVEKWDRDQMLALLNAMSPIILYGQNPQKLSADPGEPRRGPVPDRTWARVVRTDLLRRPAVPDLPGPWLLHGKGENLSTDSSYISTSSILNQSSKCSSIIVYWNMK